MGADMGYDHWKSTEPDDGAEQPEDDRSEPEPCPECARRRKLKAEAQQRWRKKRANSIT
jgi:hypothetical protein